MAGTAEALGTRGSSRWEREPWRCLSHSGCAVALDAWMFPLENLLYPEVPSPVLFINTEKFQTPESAAKMKRLSSRNSQTRIVTVL